MCGNLAFLLWGFNSRYEIEIYDTKYNTTVCGITTSVGTYVENDHHEVDSLLVGYGMLVLAFFAITILSVTKLGSPFFPESRFFDGSLVLVMNFVFLSSSYVALTRTTEVLNRYMNTNDECLQNSEEAFPVATNFLYGSFIYVFGQFITVIFCILFVVGSLTWQCFMRYCCCFLRRRDYYDAMNLPEKKSEEEMPLMRTEVVL